MQVGSGRQTRTLDQLRRQAARAEHEVIDTPKKGSGRGRGGRGRGRGRGKAATVDVPEAAVVAESSNRSAAVLCSYSAHV